MSGAAPKVAPRTCARCGAGFEPANGRQLYCSPACATAVKYRRAGARRSAARAAARAGRVCPVCGAAFSPKNARGKYCSARCANVANRKPVRHDPKPCVWCGREFTPGRTTQMYCSRECNRAASGTSRKASGSSIRAGAGEEQVRAYLALPPAERWARRGELTRDEHKLARKLYLAQHPTRTCATNDLCH